MVHDGLTVMKRNKKHINIILGIFAFSVLAVFIATNWDTKENGHVQEKPKNSTQLKMVKETLDYCSYNLTKWMKRHNETGVIIITPTYSRPEQFPELIRLSYIFKQVSNLIWILVEDRHGCSDGIAKFLKTANISYVHLASPMPDIYRKKHFLPRGVSGRRAGLKWVRSNAKDLFNSVLYFGDDDNFFTLELFSEIKKTKHVSMFPVGFVGDYSISSPIVRGNKIVGFYDGWNGGRKFAVDMAGFAVNLEVLLAHPNASMPYWAGHEEDQFLQSLDVNMQDLEPLASNCTQILVWHTKTVKNKKPKLRLKMNEKKSNLEKLLSNMAAMSMAIYP